MLCGGFKNCLCVLMNNVQGVGVTLKGAKMVLHNVDSK